MIMKAGPINVSKLKVGITGRFTDGVEGNRRSRLESLHVYLQISRRQRLP